MKIISVTPLVVPDLKIIRFERFSDHRGFFTEPFRASDFASALNEKSLSGAFVQQNESISKPNVIRGLHFQYEPAMGKLMRILKGSMVVMTLDIRVGSPTLSKIVLTELSENIERGFDEWLWIPSGFAVGIFTGKGAHMEYFCTAEYSAKAESGISPFAADIDWSIADPILKKAFEAIKPQAILSEKDVKANDVRIWLSDERSQHFQYKP